MLRTIIRKIPVVQEVKTVVRTCDNCGESTNYPAPSLSFNDGISLRAVAFDFCKECFESELKWMNFRKESILKDLEKRERNEQE